MSQDRTGSEPTAASLVGSLSSFPLVDVLELLARTGRTGELQVVGQGLDRRLWVDSGELVDTTGSGNPDTGLFEMACIEDGWFYFTLADSTPEVSGRASIPTVLDGLSSQVTEWRELVEAFPFDAMVHMSSSTPADEVQIRADQWQLLTLVGAGREVHDVLSASSLHPLDTLRTLRELAGGQLVWIEASAGDGETAENTSPPPVGNGDQTNGTAPSAAAEPPTDTKKESAPAAADGTTATPNGTADDGKSGAEKSAAPEQLQGPVMPPPISGDPWSSSLATPAANEAQAADDRS
jgi:Domain of unknown function (DUF4388)